MSEENVEAVQRMIEAFNTGWERGDPGALFDSGTVADDLEFVVFPGLPGHPPSYRGRNGFTAFMRIWTEDFEGWSIEPERLIEAPDNRVVALTLQRQEREAACRSSCISARSSRLRTATSSGFGTFPTWKKPSKPPGCRNSLT